MSYNEKLEEKIDASLTQSLSQKGEGLVDKDISIRWQNIEKKNMFGAFATCSRGACASASGRTS
jgi:hypothetical protein